MPAKLIKISVTSVPTQVRPLMQNDEAASLVSPIASQSNRHQGVCPLRGWMSVITDYGATGELEAASSEREFCINLFSGCGSIGHL